MQFSWLNARSGITNRIMDKYKGLELVKLDRVVEKWNMQELPEKIQTKQIGSFLLLLSGFQLNK